MLEPGKIQNEPPKRPVVSPRSTSLAGARNESVDYGPVKQSNAFPRLDQPTHPGLDAMPDFVELNNLPPSDRMDQLLSSKEPFKTAVLYYAWPTTPASNYSELFTVGANISDSKIADKMSYLADDQRQLQTTPRNDHGAFLPDQGDGSSEIKSIPLYQIDPPTFRLGGLFSEFKLENVLKGFDEKTPLPPVVVKQEGGHFKIQDGIHRYFASLTRGYAHIPVVVENRNQSNRS